MPYKHIELKIPKKHDKRVKLTDKQRELIVELYAVGDTSYSKLASQFGVSKRLIQFIIKPEKQKANYEARLARGGSKIYYDKDKHREAMLTHRHHKQKLYLEGELKDDDN